MITKTTYIAFIFISALFISGCFVYNPSAEFVKQRYINGVAYFNTFYNAQRAFDEAEEEVLLAQKEFSEKSSGDKPFVVPASARTKFTSSIEKNSKLLSFYPDSKWVDDALLMIGKAYFYIEDQVKAERKFLELMAKFPESEFVNEANLLLGVSYLRQKKIEQGLKQLDDLFSATLESDEETAGKASFALGQYYYSQNNFEQAEKYYLQSLPLLNDDEQSASVQFQIALCHENLKHYAKAEEAYAKVNEFSPEYNLSFKAELARFKAVVQQNRFDEALDAFNAMLDDTKNQDFYKSIHFEIANALYAQGRLKEAMEKYQFVDTTFVRTEEAAQSYFALAKIYEDTVKNYDSARVYYNKAKMEFVASKITPAAAVKAEVFNKYHDLNKDLIRFDSLLFKAVNRTIEDDTLETSFVDSASVKDSAAAVLDDAKQRKATRPGKKTDAKADSIPAVDSAKIKAKIVKELAKKELIDSLQRSIVRTQFELGGLFFLELQVADSALQWLHEVVKNHPQNEFAPRALFTIAEIYRTLQPRPQSERDSLYWAIMTNYPASPYAREARKNLGLNLEEAEPDSALLLLEKAEALSDEKNVDAAIDIYRQIAVKFSNSPMTPKALYAMGWHYENSLVNNDSALAVYKHLLGKYPSSLYASAVRPKVSEYENEKKRIEDEKKKKIEEEQLKERKEKEQKEAKSAAEAPEANSLPSPKTDSLSTLKADSLSLPKTDSLSMPRREK